MSSLDRIKGISELGRDILRAALEGRRQRQPIFVFGERGVADHEGEIKAGGRRIYGNEAVAAVAELVARGLVAAEGDDRFELTAFGARMAPALTWSRPVTAASAAPAPGLPESV